VTVAEKCRRLLAVITAGANDLELEMLIDGAWDAASTAGLPDPDRIRVKRKHKAGKGGEE